jgi:antitoxin (DNA-binding transcriptional repressor) of toxin-antitoxin stability system
MCYMWSDWQTEASVGVRELRQNLSVYLARLAKGTVFRVTDRGKAVALLIPLPPAARTTDRLVAAGRAEPAKRDLLSLGRPVARTKTSLSKAHAEARDDRL